MPHLRRLVRCGNPIGTFLVDGDAAPALGELATAERVMAAIEKVTANPALHTRDLGGNATTIDVTIAVCDALVNLRDGVSS